MWEGQRAVWAQPVCARVQLLKSPEWPDYKGYLRKDWGQCGRRQFWFKANQQCWKEEDLAWLVWIMENKYKALMLDSPVQPQNVSCGKSFQILNPPKRNLIGYYLQSIVLGAIINLRIPQAIFLWAPKEMIKTLIALKTITFTGALITHKREKCWRW